MKTSKKELNEMLNNFMNKIYFGTGEYCFDIGLINLGDIEKHVDSIKQIIERSSIKEG